MAGKIYETAIRIGAKLASSFKPTTLSAAAAVSRIGDQSKKLTAASKGAADLARLAAEADTAASSLARASDEEKRLGAAAAAAGKPTAEMKAQMRAAAAATKAAEREMTRARAAADKAGASLAKAGIDTHKLAVEQARLAMELAHTERRMSVAGALVRAGDSARKVGGNLRSLGADVAKVAAGAGAAGAALAALVTKTADVGDEIGDTAANLGIGTRTLQELRFAAERGGSSAEDLDKGLAKFNETTGDALSGNKAARASFAALGIDMKALRNATPEQRFNLLADAVAKIPDPARRAAAASNFLGKASKSMVDLLSKGSAGLNELRGQSIGVMSDEAIENAGRAKNAMQGAGAAFRGVGNILGAELLPVATRVLELFTGWIGTNQDKIQAWAQGSAAWIEGRAIPALEKLGPRLLDVATKGLALIDRAAGMAGGIENLGVAVAAVRLAPFAASVVGLTKDVVVLTAKMVAYATATWGANAAQTALSAAQAGAGAMVPAAAGAGSKALGLLGAAGGVLAAGAAGVAIGTAFDRWTGASDKIARAFAGPASADVGSGEIPVWTAPAKLQDLRPVSSAARIDQRNTISIENLVVPPGMSREEAQAFTESAVVAAMEKHEASRRRLAFQ